MKTRAIGLAALLALSFAHAVEAQEASRSDVSFSGGLGAGTLGLGGHASLTVSLRSGDYILRTAGTTELAIFGPADDVEDFAVLYGRRKRWTRAWARAALGPAYVQRVERGDVEECAWFFCRHEERTSSALGLASQLDLVWAPVQAFGLGLTGLANLNTRQSFGALILSVHLGGVR